jgi:membrane protease YdiL (CAAX protease family)
VPISAMLHSIAMSNSVRGRRYVAVYPVALFAAWVGAWAINLALRSRIGWSARTDTLYWIGMKLAIWVAPALVAIRTLERVPLAQFLQLRSAAAGIRWGLGAGIAIAIVNYVGKTLPSGGVLHPVQFDLVFLNAVIVSPLVEEITLRGFLQERLEMDGSPAWANLVTTGVFVAMHLPGWFFQGRETTLAGYTARLLPLAVLSLIFGWIKQRSGSLYAPVLAHAINNLDSALLP